ncbi:unnamed protein product [Linum tenue]|uniref:Polygalacturonase n=1 Tax=Linum tenue TaxID=586396 RepID=A0AAV0IHT1_9ROSI|nr:unnamed protein product [Linum tenue]
MLKPIVFYGPCQSKMLFHVEGKVVGPKHYWEFGKSGFWILFYKLEKLTILGGTYDAQGSDYWACRKSQSQCSQGTKSRNVVVKGIKSLNPQMFHLAIDHCHQVLLKKLYIEAPTRSPNTDGIHIMSSEGITIAGAVIKTGDDCIAIGPGTKNVHIRGVGSGVKISGVTYRNIHGTSASPIAVKFVCSASRPCTGLQLHNVRLTYHKAIASSVCTHAGGGVSGVVSPRSCFRK